MTNVLHRPDWGDHLDAPYGVRIIELTQGQVALVSEQDYPMLSKWKWHYQNTKASSGYADRTSRMAGVRRKVRMHRLIVDVPEGKLPDHINRNGIDNRRCNLRVVTRSQNTQNVTRVGSSGYRGVYRHKKKWAATFCWKGKQVHIGAFLTSQEAALAYDEKAREFYGDDAYTNF